MRSVGFWGLLAVLWLAACSKQEELIGTPVPNATPDTEVTGTPPLLSQTTFTVEFFWKGFDEDGEVAGYEWRITDNGVDGIIDPADSLEARVPWNFTTATDSVFVVTANIDSFLVDVNDPQQDAGTYRYWQTHTFFVRSVDDDGARDPSPANVSFTATTIAPNIRITVPEPRSSITCISSAKVLTFGWEGADPDRIEGDPAAVRYLLLPVNNSEGSGCLTQNDYESASPAFIYDEHPLWSDWISYDAVSDSGRIVTLPRQEAGQRFLFAVQARDVAGAVTPTFEWGRNVRHIETSDGKFPVLEVCETFLGCNRFVGTNGVKGFEIVSGQPLEFEWDATAAEYAGIVEAFRYGWNVVDPNDPEDPGWQLAWGNGPSWRRALPRTFTQGSPNLVVQCRDNSGTISRTVYTFQVVQAPDRADQRNLLLVDDWDSSAIPVLEAEWDNLWQEILSGRVQGFQPADVIDTAQATQRVTFGNIADYKAIVWFASPGTETFLHSRFAPQSRTEPRYNWLEIYQAQVGNLLLVGPGQAYNSFERDPPGWILPIFFNVSANYPLGFGTITRADGSDFNVGVSRWPYSGWCIDSVDLIRPAVGSVFAETPGNILRTKNCDAIAEAVVPEEFLETFPDAAGVVRNLRPDDTRTNLDPLYKPSFEEFYNTNVTRRATSIFTRPCQQPMFKMVSRRDAGLVDNPGLACLPIGAETSLLQGAPIGVVSSRYSETKQLTGSEDFLWGFHPFSFEIDDIASSVLWILESRWQLAVLR